MKKGIIITCLLFLIVSQPIRAEEEKEMTIDLNEHGSIMLIIDYETGLITEANQAATEFYGYSLEEIQQINISDINILSTEAVKKEMELAKDEKRNFFEFRHRLKSGEIKDVEVYSSPIKIGERICLFSVIHDVSDRVLAEQSARRGRTIIYVFILVFVSGLSLFLIRQTSLKRHLKRLNRRYDSLFSNMKEGVALYEMIWDEEGKAIDYTFLEINDAFEGITGLRREDIIGKTVKQVMPQTEDYWIQEYGAVAMSGKSISYENYSVELNKHFKVNVYRPSTNQFVTVFMDVTKDKLSQEIIANERALFKTTLFSLGDAVITTDMKGNIELMNGMAETMSGWTIEEVKGLAFCEVFRFIDEVSKDIIYCPVEDVIATKSERIVLENIMLVQRQKKEIPIENSISPIIGSDEKMLGVVVVLKDFTEKKKRLNRITYLSYHDQLTGLYNRHFFNEESSRLDTLRNLPLTLLMLDVNGLKLTNDVFGHHMGDELLINVSKVLKKACRPDDIIARIGGDEFVILLPKTTAKVAEKVVERVYNTIKEMHMEKIVISVSIGWYTKVLESTSMKDVFVKAEEMMYRKKLVESQKMRNDTVDLILTNLSKANQREKKHSDKVSRIALQIGELMKLNDVELRELKLAGVMHDIGKITVNSELFNIEGPLSQKEWEEIQQHPEMGYRILRSVDKYSDVADSALSHHERWDGSGYPRGLKNHEIPLYARIIAVADAVEAMSSFRPYRKPRTYPEVIEELEKCSGTQFDPEIIDCCKDKLIIEE